MFAHLRVTSVILLALPLLAAAGGSEGCENKSQLCCKDVKDAQDPGVAKLLENLLNVDLGSITGLVGLTCGPLSGGCTEETVCCSNNNFDGLVAIGCTPINVNL